MGFQKTKIIGLILLGLVIWGYTGHSEARLDPFYIVHNQSFNQTKPRILIVLDNSGSMAFDETYDPNAMFPNTKCWWDNCENGGAGVLQSRIHGSRNVIRELAEQNKDQADFALMTFGNAAPPVSSAEVPIPCLDLDTNEEKRFTWIETVNQPYSTQWKPASNAFGGQGFWVLCGDNRPFPYLRHDDLGAFALSNNSNENLLNEPLYVQKSNLTEYEEIENYSRKVQFFPRFLGRRTNLDCSDDNIKNIALGSFGDWGNTDAEKLNAVCDHDYYYWPYVDGNPGYSYYSGKSTDNFEHQECSDNEVCDLTSGEVHRLGVVRRNQWVGASLYAPFYSKEILEDPNISGKGPLSEADAQLMFDGLTDKQYAGGVDVSGGTPMAVAVGIPEFMVFTNGGVITGPKPAMSVSNASFEQPTISSYLAFMRTTEENDLCRPISMIVVTDGQPEPWNTQGGTKLYERLSSVRRVLGVKSYIVALSDGVVSDPLKFERVHHIACAAAGSEDVLEPCLDNNDLEWDTCQDSTDPENACAFLASNHEELNDALIDIISQTISTTIPSGTPTVANDFQLADPEDPESSQEAVQTNITSWTESPEGRGHVVRSGCLDDTQDYCTNADILPLDTKELETFGPCELSRVWDAGECLSHTLWTERKLYTHNFDNENIRIAIDGVPTPEFETLVLELNDQGKINPPLTFSKELEEIAEMVSFLLGENLPNGWKLPGITNSAPILIRRVPQYDSKYLPSVGIRDPHCAGRTNGEGSNIPTSLEGFSISAWEVVSGGGFDDHYDYTEAVLVGDDFGVLHAFHYNSGNELFGFLPMALINNSRVLSVNGPDNFGQPQDLEDHIFGLASTVNAGWVYDEETEDWRHLAVFGIGPGGSEIITVDVSHMGRLQEDDPIEVLWTSGTTNISADYMEALGETWSRPALTYAVPNHSMALPPKGYLVFGSGYRNGVGLEQRGRTIWAVDAITGDTIVQKAFLPIVTDTYDTEDNVTAVADIALGSHCLSGYWGEMQEAYIVDPSGRLFRWDLAAGVSDVTSFTHEADSNGPWAGDMNGFPIAEEAFRFPACQGDDDFSCSIASIGSNKGDIFTLSPAVVANNRIDGDGAQGVLPQEDRDQFLIALISGNIKEDTGQSDFHSSLYLLVDDHRQNSTGGFSIPNDAPKTLPGDHSSFMRLPLSEIERTRTIVFPDDTEEEETRAFSKAAQPIGSPTIRVTGAVDGNESLDVEVFYVTYTVYEPGNAICDSRWYDVENKEWVYDQGSTYEIAFRLVVSGDDTFDFQNGYSLPGDYGDGFGTGGSLSGPVVSQLGCEGDNCGLQFKAHTISPCDPNQDSSPVGSAISISTNMAELVGFSPLEIEL